jgi:hypothetical protein
MKSGAETKGKAGHKAEMNGKSKPSTTGAGSADEGKTGGKAGANTKAKPSTTGAGPSENKAGSSTSGANEMKSGTNEMKSGTKGEQSPTAKSPSSAQGTSSSTTAQGSAGSQGASVNLTAEQKTQIRTTVLQSSSAPKISRSQVNFNIAVGTVVPRTVHFVTVPETLIRIHPAWRGYSYFVVDEEIIIVEPRTFKIVAVLTV